MNEKAKPTDTGITIDLTGPGGNANNLLGAVKTLGRQLSMGDSKITDIRDRMKSSNYEHLVDVFDEEFGEYVTLLR